MRLARALVASVVLCATAGVAGALEPADVMVLYNTKSAASLDIAKTYMQARHIPEGNLIPLICAEGETTTQAEYSENIVPQVRKALASRPNAKCLVTTDGIPLAIGPYVPPTAVKAEMAGFKARLDQTIRDMESETADYDLVAAADVKAAGTQVSSAAAGAVKDDPASVEKVFVKINAAANAAGQRVGKLSEADRGAAMDQMLKVQERAGGLMGLVTGFRVRGDSPGALAVEAKAAEWKAQLQDVQGQIIGLMKDKADPAARQKIVDLEQVRGGSVGEARELLGVVNYLDPPETSSCFDNELAMVLADQDYPLGRWLPNFQNVDFYPPTQRWSKVPRTILVCRLDGSTPGRVEGMIAQSLKTEKAGLRGKMYLDARGLTSGSYAVFDVQLRALAKFMKEHSTMECVLDDKPAMLEAKNCPDAALYCGWYSLEHYVDVCQWVAGGVGFHLASGEMISLHKANNTEWVVNLLNRGYCGTLGPTAEPYLESFPNPAHFFPLLLCGEFTQGEVWEVTAPMLSWRTGYVGDPLYNPFKNDPQVKVEVIRADPVLRNAFAILRGGEGARPTSPAPASPPSRTANHPALRP